MGEWIAYADASDAKREEANDRKSTALWIIDNCEAEERKAVEKLTHKPWYKFWSR